jgi:hypothetical protein
MTDAILLRRLYSFYEHQKHTTVSLFSAMECYERRGSDWMCWHYLFEWQLAKDERDNFANKFLQDWGKAVALVEGEKK